ncbi:CaiB/BaiF CoA transferase family protein [Alkalimonas amylolytica]|uniref:Crotonobetainyl-CoA:carnitine CoA-transferase CaiB n=1 Tax=Alkalimonas amylolytica TaxID=152573 RepID=A0A1H4BAZ5_ALKAM|nr:CaiB/BaiF CoA-transferase family protein [Alkalimonas amylolytica]SEA45301.1 Crotonobetainyl-CoA:carnitine CoA-transferase CaiB [Alkalimonas amylolytica]
MAGPLQGVKVLDLSRILAGPWASQVLADYGAEVWKIEKPGEGDDTRQWGPPFLHDQEGQNTGQSAYFLSANRGKKSLCIDIQTEQGQLQIKQLAQQADILLENYKVGGLARYGLNYASLKASHPRLIYCSITGFGQTGPYANQAGYDAMIQGLGGLMSITGEPDTHPGGGPQKVGVAVADLMTGMYAVSAILAALHHRNQTGQGQYIDLALLDTQVAWLANQASNYLVSGEVPQRLGTAHPNIVPYQAMQVKDGFILLAVGNDRQFRSCCAVLGCADLADDPRFSSNALRVQHRDVLIPRLATQLLQHGVAHWVKALSEQHVPCGPINNLEQVFANPQVQARGMHIQVMHAKGYQVPMVANPVKFSATPLSFDSAPPELGEHTDAVLQQLGKGR